MKRWMSLLLAVLLFAVPLAGCAEETGYVKEENTARDAVSYPYLIRTPYAAAAIPPSWSEPPRP